MVRCQNCGQNNSNENNFCRFCGTKFSHMPLHPPTENQMEAPSIRRPYLWKTDELQLKKWATKITQRINQFPYLTDIRKQTNQDIHTQQNKETQVYHANQQSVAAYSYSCPMCASRRLPKVTREISTEGWVIFAVLLTFCFPLFWIGLMIKKNVEMCPDCNFKSG